jgi:hypothetical protein
MGGMNGGAMNSRRGMGNNRGNAGEQTPVEMVVAKWTPRA